MSRLFRLGALVKVTLAHGPILNAVLRARTVAVPVRPLLAPPHGVVKQDEQSSRFTSGIDVTRTDEALVAAIRAASIDSRGERAAAEEELYRRHAGAVLGLATRLLHSRDDAMDVMQDAFVTVFEQLASLREPAAFRAWLLRVTASLVHRRFRRRKLLAMLGLGGSREQTALDELADPATSTETRAELRLLDRKLARVSERDRAAWLLRYVDGFALEEVAEACGCSLATAKRRIAAAEAVVNAHFSGGEP